jgi:hypothetical protein
MIRLHRTLPVVLIGALVLLIGGCDSTGTGGGDNTITLNENSGLDPVQHFLSYSEGDYQNGQVVVTAGAEASLAQRLRDLDYSLSDVSSAEITAVTMLRSSAGTAAMQDRKVFPYLSRAEVYLGGTNGTLIASLQQVPSPELLEPVPMNVEGGSIDVTSFVRNGATNATLRLQLDDPNEIGGDSGTSDSIELTITYSVTVPLE